MKIYVIRHGQPDLETFGWDNDPEHPAADPILTKLGREQASYAAQYFKKINYNGLIISSPYRRTLDTAQIIATQIDAEILVDRRMQEYVSADGIPDFIGLTKEKIQQKYPCVTSFGDFPYPWFFAGPEDLEVVKNRLKSLIKEILHNKKDLLLVGHGASVHACKELFLQERFSKNAPENHNWNCSISTYNFNDNSELNDFELFNIEHMPLDIVTSNNRKFLTDCAE